MSDNGGEDQPSSSGKSPSKPPRPPPPSNISKLPRPPSIQKHLEALQGLKPDKVRWFVKELEDKKWLPFNGCDSLAIEHCYLQILALENRIEDSTKILNTTSIYDMATVKGGLYEVDVVARECKPIYWKGKSLSVCRGTWFTGSSAHETWQPVSEEDAAQIEASNQTMLRAMGLQVGPIESDKTVATEQQGLGRLKLKGFYVEWNDIADVWLYWDDVKSRIIRGVGERIGYSSGAASQLHRGYHTDASPDDRPPDICHLVFVIHGIGQLLHMSNIVKSCADLRQGAATVLGKQHDIPPDKRVEFIPVEWRSSLKLDEGTIECITPSSVSGLRKVLNTSMMDIMYYTSPFYRYEIIDGVREEMNRLYTMFCTRNPSFLEKGGKVSIVAHSLGSVITYDILTLWDIELRHLSHDATTGTGFLTESLQYLRSVTSRTSIENMETGSEGKRKKNLRVELANARSQVMKLEALIASEVEHEKHGANSSSNECPYALRFKVENLFCVGSPLAVFLALRGLRPQDDVEDHVLPKSVCKRLVNIYHPADPVAYRLEPLISGDYTSIPPVQLHRYDSKQAGYSEAKPNKTGQAGKWGGLFKSYRVGFSKQKTEEDTSDKAAGSNSEENMEDDDVVIVHNATSADNTAVNDTDGQCVVMATDGPSTASKRTSWIASLFGSSSSSSQESEETDGAKKQEHGNKEEHITVPAKVLRERLDYTLREGYMESNYWSAVTSHVSYWTSCDVARFILENCLDSTPGSTQNMELSVD